ncbi:uncharacterized protein LOC143718618 [Siphateles boraxobius]|uniref:uncharacterized protein LOC143718618 n=1 Tax=Siphateles boraxobius TaxID=180520 RepID=UPI004063F3D9
MLPFVVVEFLDSRTVAIIPRNWFTGPEEEECYWPPSSTVNVDQYVREGKEPQEDWAKFQVQVLGKAVDYTAARAKLRKAEVTSDLQTDPEPERAKRKRKLKFIDPDSDSEECPEMAAPPPPRRLLIKGLGNQRTATPPPPHLLKEAQTPGRSTPAQTGSSSTPCRPLQPSGIAVRDGMFVRVLTILEEIKDCQKVQGSMIRCLLQQREQNCVVPVLPEGVPFPLKSFTEVDDLELKLCESDFQKNLVSVLGDIGGRSLDECVCRTMAFLMTNDLARQLNLTGRHGKRSFRSLRLFDTLHGSLKQNTILRTVSKKEVETALGKWFTNARDRDGNRALRAQPNLVRRAAQSEVFEAEDSVQAQD